MSTPILTVHVAASAVPVAACLKKYYAMRGYIPVPLADDQSPAIEFVIVAARPRGYVTIVPDPPEQCGDAVVAYLSQHLRGRAYLILLNEPSVLAKQFDSGHETASATITPEGFVYSGDAGLGEILRTTEGPVHGLETLGLRYLKLGTVDPKDVIRVGFVTSNRRASAQDWFVDPLLQCPMCKQPMVERTGPRGRFLGCISFPACRGILTVEQAENQRKARALR